MGVGSFRIQLRIHHATIPDSRHHPQWDPPPDTLVSQSRPDYPFKPVPFTKVHLNDVFWAPRIEVNRTSSIPAAFQQCELTGRVNLFERAAKALKGEPLDNTRPPGYPFDDTDVYKVIEGASYTLSVEAGSEARGLRRRPDREDRRRAGSGGYLYTTRTINPKEPHRWAGTERWELERDDGPSSTASGTR